ncbi:MAG: DUF6297 family protein [Propionibacteriaceae bacterium]|jgi:hypothetical protein|nr:DUF6297 family protein [Propionibacteriaceae bacterium]
MSKKARKRGAEVGVGEVLAQEEGAPESQSAAEPEAPAEASYYFLPDAEPLDVDERELHDLMKWWRHGRATRTIWQALSDGYVTVFVVVMLAAMVTNVVIHAQGSMAGCDTTACLTGRLLLPSATVFACYALSLAVGRLFGPVLASAAEGSWLMDAPISRHYLLRGRLVWPLLGSFLIGGLVTALVAALSGLDWLDVGILGAAAGVGAAALMAYAAAEQSSERTLSLKLLQNLSALLAVAILLVVVSIATGWLPVGVVALSPISFALGALAVGMAVLFAVSLRLALRRLDDIRRARLLSGGSLVSGMQGAMFALDFGLIRDILVDRQAIEKGHVRPTRGRGVGLAALVWRDVERLVRNPKPFVGLVLSLVVPYAADALGIVQLKSFVSALALMAVMVPFLGSLRVLTRTGGLARTMPFKTASIRTASMAVPGVLALLWALAAAPAFVGIAGPEESWELGMVSAFCTAAAGLFGGCRWVTAKKVDYAVPMMATQAGAMPPTLIFNIFRGFDVVAVVTAPLILQAGPVWSLGLAFGAFIVVRGTFNLDELKAESEAAQRELQAAKAQAPVQKKKVPRPGAR